ncbi:MAG: PilZ domain-containing protein [Deltaproteobacteria bacterium]|jgi:hypothetical protein|nr:PilZ domain-containing protein [Deltaproteobacteria bacterium]
MPDDTPTNHLEEKRSEHRDIVDQPCSVEINLGRPIPAYQMKLRDISGHGSCILVKEDSSILKHLMVGQNLKMKYWTESRAETRGYLRAQVIHISKPEAEQFKNHYSIGLLIEEKHDFVRDKPESRALKTDGDINVDMQGDAERRQATERRQVISSGYVPERRSGQDRRSGLERRAGVDRRTGADRRSARAL